MQEIFCLTWQKSTWKIRNLQKQSTVNLEKDVPDMLHMPSEDIMVSNHLEVFIAIIPIFYASPRLMVKNSRTVRNSSVEYSSAAVLLRAIKGIAERFPVFLGSKSVSQIFNLLQPSQGQLPCPCDGFASCPFVSLMVICFIHYTLISRDGLGFNANSLLPFTMRFSTSSRVMLRTMFVSNGCPSCQLGFASFTAS